MTNFLARALGPKLLSRIPGAGVSIVMPGGIEVTPDRRTARNRIHLKNPGAVFGLLFGSSATWAELYCAGDIVVEGDLVSLLAQVNRLAMERNAAPGSRARVLRSRARRIGRRQARWNAARHYSLDHAFFSAWLDEGMSYTCAYFPEAEMTLEEAQTAKMGLICGKLRVGSQDRVVEAGCGWGALALHIARTHGASVRAFNVSEEQVAWARDRARREGLDRRVEFVLGDYREIDQSADVFVSVGMLEHVGPRHYQEFGAIIARSIGDHGRALLHTISRVQPTPTDRWIDRRIFPGGYTPALSEMASVFEPNRLAVVHLENLRADYARTLEAWLRNFDAACRDTLAVHDPALLRSWRLYLAASQAAFLTGWAQIHQLVLTSWKNTSFPAPGRQLPWPRPAEPRLPANGVDGEDMPYDRSPA